VEFAPNVVDVRAWRLGDDEKRPYFLVPCYVVGAGAVGSRKGPPIKFTSPADVLWRSVLAKWERLDGKASCRHRRI
jgi:hypothetical protein